MSSHLFIDEELFDTPAVLWYCMNVMRKIRLGGNCTCAIPDDDFVVLLYSMFERKAGNAIAIVFGAFCSPKAIHKSFKHGALSDENNSVWLGVGD